MTEAVLVLAREDEALAVLAAGGPLATAATWPRVPLGPLTTLEVAELVGLALDLDDRAVEALGTNPDPIAHGTSEEGPWLYRLPSDFAPTLARLPDPALNALAERWVASEDLADHTPAAVLATLRAAAALSRNLTPPQTLLLWIRS